MYFGTQEILISAVIQMIHRLFRLICPIKIIFVATLLITITSPGQENCLHAAKNKDRKIMERDKTRQMHKMSDWEEGWESQKRILNPVEHVRWSFFAKIVTR